MTQATADGVKVSAGELEQLAEKAAPGNWRVPTWRRSRRFVDDGDGWFIAECAKDPARQGELDAAYIAAANPQTMKALLADWRAMRKALREQCECVSVDAEVITCEGCKVLRGLNVRD